MEVASTPAACMNPNPPLTLRPLQAVSFSVAPSRGLAHGASNCSKAQEGWRELFRGKKAPNTALCGASGPHEKGAYWRKAKTFATQLMFAKP
eukprot:5258740-Amphidinium_carterae.1